MCIICVFTFIIHHQKNENFKWRQSVDPEGHHAATESVIPVDKPKIIKEMLS